VALLIVRNLSTVLEASMTPTQRELAAIGDATFERLAASFLRRRRPYCAGIKETGTNDEGKPVPYPVDAIGFIDGDPPVCVAAAYTTIALPKLRGKWFGTQSDKGDIEKARTEFNAWKQSHPDARCILYLCTNRRLGSNAALVREVAAYGKQHGLTIEIVEASELEEFLDRTPEGQYLRQEFLDIPAGQLGRDLLDRIAAISLDAHRRSYPPESLREGRLVVRDAEGCIKSLLAAHAATTIGLRGSSGMGKSTLLRRIGEAINETGGVALWVPAEEMAPGTDLSAILLNVLKRFYPSLVADAGDEALRLAATIEGGLVLLVDDINRLDAPQRALAAIRACCIAPSTHDGAPPQLQPVRFVVPLWPDQASYLDRSKDAMWRFVDILPFSLPERARLTALAPPGDGARLSVLYDALNGDPFLCARATVATSVHVTAASRTAVMREIYEDLAGDAAQAVVDRRVLAVRPGEVLEALDALVGLMVTEMGPEPEWRRVRVALSDRRADILDILAQTSKLGWIETRHGRDYWRWAHDRVRDALVGRWLAHNALEGHVADADAWLSDPGLTGACALALVFLSTPDAQLRALQHLAALQPLALAVALRLGLYPAEEGMHSAAQRSAIVASLASVVGRLPGGHYEEMSSTRTLVLNELVQTRDPLVIDVARAGTQDLRAWLARFRNGNIEAALVYLVNRTHGNTFLPEVQWREVEDAVALFKDFWDDRRGDVVAYFQHIRPDVALVAALTLAGYLAWPELVEPLWRLWDGQTEAEKAVTLVHIVWMLSRCGDDTVRPYLEASLLRLRTVGDDAGDTNDGEAATQGRDNEHVQNFATALYHARRWPVTPMAIATWVRIAESYPDLRNAMYVLLSGIDDPDATRVYVDLSAKGQGGHWIFWGDHSHTDGEGRPLPISQASRDYLWSRAETEQDVAKRGIAFELWGRAASDADLPTLCAIPEESSLFDMALDVRLHLHDRTAVPYLIERLQTDPGRWGSYAGAFYGEPGVSAALLENADKLFHSDMSAKYTLCRDLPPEGIAALVRQHGDLLRQFSFAWHDLWRSRVPTALALVREAIAQGTGSESRQLFLHGGYPFPVTRDMLDALRPVLDRFPSQERRMLAEVTILSGHEYWVQLHLPDITMPVVRDGIHMLTQEQVITALDNEVARMPTGPLSPTQWDFRLLQYGQATIDLMQVVCEWLGTEVDGNRLIIAALLLEARGTGRDINWWQECEPRDNDMHVIWANTLATLRRRRWRSVIPSSE